MNKRSTKWYRKNEAEVMHRLGLKPTRNSGAGWIEKCDGESEHFLCELKSTDHESFSIKQSVLHVLEHHALEAHKIPLFAFQFINRDEVWVAIKEEDIKAYRELIEREVLSKLEEEDEFINGSIECSRMNKATGENIYSILCKINEILIVLKKELDKQNGKVYYKGEKERGGSEAVSFMLNTKEDKLHNLNTLNNTNDLDVLNKQLYNIDKLLNKLLNLNNSISTNRNSDIKQSIDVININEDINATNNIDVNKLKHNINARNNYFKQKEQERRKQEQKFKTERRKTK